MIAQIKSYAHKIGFDLVRIIKAQPAPIAQTRIKKWLASGFAADMAWMKNRAEIAHNPQRILPGAKSIICLAANYFTSVPPRIHKDGVRIARYAWCKNYHKIIEKRLKKFGQFIQQLAPDARLKYYVDTGPFLERHFAAQSGLGVIGKNTCLITREFGSYVFLAEIITDLSLAPDKPAKQKFSCGTCSRCIDSCPTGALIAPYTLDSRRCISYLTIESRGRIPRHLQAKIPPWVFGCDICQEACPHNARAQPTPSADFSLSPIFKKLTLDQLQSIKTKKEFTRLFSGTSCMRAKFKGIKANLSLTHNSSNKF